MLTRRFFLGGAAALAAARPAAAAADEAAALLARIRAPQFPGRTFDITRFGAKDGGQAATAAISGAIEACFKAGGGRVLVPRGTFLTGPIHLKSNVNLHLEEGATLLFSSNPHDYLPLVYTRFEGTECMNYSPLIYAWEQNNIAVTGAGTLDGQADERHWWPWKVTAKPNEKLVPLADRDVPVAQRVMGDGFDLRPNFLQPYRSNNVLIEGITIRNSPMWEINPVLCRNVIIRSVRIDSHGPNNDGCDPESSTDVLVENCEFSTGDDCIAIKSGRNRDGRRVGIPCENVIVRNCRMKDGHGGVSIGSEVSGGVRNVFIENNRMDSPHLERALRIKTNSYRGGAIENIYFRDNAVGEVAQAVVDIDFYYQEGEGGPFKPAVRNIVVDNVTSQRSRYAVYLRGYKEAPIGGVRIDHCTFREVAEADRIENVADVRIENSSRNGRPMTR
jgi:polygalacturonase